MSSSIPQKSLGQHWLMDGPSLTAICDAADLKKSDTVLEIGPGTGELTVRLLERGARVVAVELDESLKDDLNKRFDGLPFTLNMLSILKFDLSSLPKDYKVVANIPYYLTNHLLRMLSETQHKPSLIVLLVQKEVAQRVTAKPGDISLLSVSVQLHYDAMLGKVIPAKLFLPPPKVDSQILIMKRRETLLFENLDEKRYFQVVKAGFSNRRKTLPNSLSGGLQMTKTETLSLLRDVGVDPGMRAQELTLEQWYSLYKQVNFDNT